MIPTIVMIVIGCGAILCWWWALARFASEIEALQKRIDWLEKRLEPNYTMQPPWAAPPSAN